MLPQLCPSSGFQSLKAPTPAFPCSLCHPGNSSWFLGAQGEWSAGWSMGGGQARWLGQGEALWNQGLAWGRVGTAVQAHPEERALSDIHWLRGYIFLWLFSPADGALF